MSCAILPPLPAIPHVEVRHVPGFPGYAISSDGRIWSCKFPGPALTPYRDTWRQMHTAKNPIYVTICLRSNGRKATYYVHQLVLQIFIGPCPPSYEACHKDDNEENNHVSNLYWGTKKQNAEDKRRNGHLPVGEKHFRTTLTIESVKEIRQLFLSGVPQKVIGRRFGIHQTTVSDICRRKVWRHVG